MPAAQAPNPACDEPLDREESLKGSERDGEPENAVNAAFHRGGWGLGRVPSEPRRPPSHIAGGPRSTRASERTSERCGESVVRTTKRIRAQPANPVRAKRLPARQHLRGPPGAAPLNGPLTSYSISRRIGKVSPTSTRPEIADPTPLGAQESHEWLRLWARAPTPVSKEPLPVGVTR
jgi:hypothetical protein